MEDESIDSKPTLKLNRYREATLQIPTGETRTYTDLAALAGRPGAARAAGRAMSECPVDADEPWHRVISADGSLAHDPERALVQLARLRAESARPLETESVEAWALRRGASCIGRWKGRVFVAAPDPRAREWPANEVEALGSQDDARARGFRPLDSEAREKSSSGESAARAKRSRSRPRRSIDERLASIDWARAIEELRARGFTIVPGLIEERERNAWIEAFGEPSRFERTIDMAPRGYGIGTYRYWKEPLPATAARVRSELYARLRDLASAAPGAAEYPPTLAEFFENCRANGQRRSSSILLRYEAGGVNHAHRDIYGKQWFPYQAVAVLSRRGVDFEGGEFVLHRRGSSSSEVHAALALDAGDLCVFASRGYLDTHDGEARWIELEHGMRSVTRGERFALGIVLHLAE